MATKTFSCRADEQRLAYADAVVRERFGMSFGQYCGSVLVDAVAQGAALPVAADSSSAERKAHAIEKLKGFSQRPHNERIGRMTDGEIKDLIASRYE